jgi:replicative DNA helicase
MDVEQIYDEYAVMLNHIFANAETEVKSHSLSDGLDELIDELDAGIMIGIDYYEMPLLNHETGGRLLGNLDMIGAVSNLGKSTIARNLCIPASIKNKEPLCIIINEESVNKTKQEMLVWVANIVLKHDIQKYVVRDGKFTAETKAILKESAQWIRDNAEDLIRIIPFQRYTVELAMKTISKYAHAGFKYFIIDTMKLNANSNGEVAWLDLQQSSVKLYDLIKPENLNVHVLFTYQLSKAAVKQKYLSQDSLGMSKSVVDVCSTAILARALHQDEFEGGKNELKVYRLDGKNGKTKLPVRLDKEKNYQIFFIAKNRSGSTSYQIVVENDLSRNKIVEVGICTVVQDW